MLAILAMVLAFGWASFAPADDPKGNVLPIISTSDVIGYITPCG
jgi:hypothetical protein